MAPEKKTDKKLILDAVIAMIDESGWESVSARNLAARLGISTQPIYNVFGDMASLKAAATMRGFEEFAAYIAGDAIDQASRYVMFAAERGNLFKFLFRGSGEKCGGLDDLSHRIIKDTGIIEKLCGITGLSEAETYRLHLFLWMALHGLAVYSADNSVKLSDAEVKEFTRDITTAMTNYIKKEK